MHVWHSIRTGTIKRHEQMLKSRQVNQMAPGGYFLGDRKTKSLVKNPNLGLQSKFGSKIVI